MAEIDRTLVLESEILGEQSGNGNGAKPEPATPAVDASMFAAKPRSQKFVQQTGSTEITAAVELRRPHDGELFRVHGDPAFQVTVPLLVAGTHRQRAFWWVLGDELQAEVDAQVTQLRDFYLLATVNLQGVGFLWPIRCMDRPNAYITTAHDAALVAISTWVRIEVDQNKELYRSVLLKNVTKQPAWPDWSPEEWRLKAFASRLIRDRNHPILRELRGEE